MHRVAVPGGVWPDGPGATGPPRRDFELRAVDGEDEAFLLDTADHALPGERATSLLARCLRDVDVRALTVGDREALLLHLRRLSLGESIACVLRCPAEACGEPMDLELRVGELLVPAYRNVCPEYTVTADAAGRHWEATFRLPTAGDLDDAGALARDDAERAAGVLLERCVLRALRDGEPVAAGALSPVREAIAAAMVEHDPQAEIELDLQCPSCRGAFSVVFDTAMFLLQELNDRAVRLAQEVHTLAWHYHWSESDVLRLPRTRRARYLELVADAVARSRAR